MARIEHTPGPWRIDKTRFDRTTVFGDRPGWTDYPVANTGDSSSNRPEEADLRDQQEANARLIAAAPELLEALRACRPLLNQPLAAQANAAIAKATGEAN